MNYIKHLNAVFQHFSKDGRLNPTHISLYMGLFQLWNQYHFSKTFHINREEVMELSKIGSKSTYHRCIKELNHWSYLQYTPSHNPFRGSRIQMFDFGTSTEQLLYPSPTKNGTSDGQVVVPKNKPIQTQKNYIKKNKTEISVVSHSANGNKPIPTVPFRDNLKTTKEKDYGEPL